MNAGLNFLANTAFIWLPVVLFFILRSVYLEFKKQSYRASKLNFSKYKILEINIPKEIHKSPQAMEFIIDVLHHLGGGAMDWKQRYWSGSILYPSSLEIVSIEGSIYFFIRTHEKLADLVKSTIYSQFPQAEVSEVDDYTRHVPNYNHHQYNWSLYGADFKLSGEDFIPIKTYIDYGLDQSVGKLEEFQKIDPLTPMIEFLSTLGPGEQVWIQYVIRGDAQSDWRKRAQAFIEDKMDMSKKVKKLPPNVLKQMQAQLGELIAGPNEEVQDDLSILRLSHGEQEQIKMIQRGLSKYAFETVIRAVYLSKNEKYNPAVKGFFKNPVFKPFASLFHNSIRKNTDTDFDWVWEDLSGRRDPAKKRRFFNDYVNREAFYRPFWKKANFWFKDPKPMIFTSEELATLFHLPGTVSETPALERIDATKSQPPQDLPI